MENNEPQSREGYTVNGERAIPNGPFPGDPPSGFHFAIEYQHDGEWHRPLIRFDTEDAALRYGQEFAGNSFSSTPVRAVDLQDG